MMEKFFNYQKIKKNALHEPPQINNRTVLQKPLRTSDYNMGSLDFLRYHELLKLLNQVSLLVKYGRNDMLPQYYAILDELYVEFRDDVNDQLQKEMDSKFQLAEKYLYNTKTDELDDDASVEMHIALRPLLKQLHRDIFYIRKLVGISYPRSIRLTSKQKLEGSLRV